MTTTIKSVRAEAYRVPLARPVQFATRAVAAREYMAGGGASISGCGVAARWATEGSNLRPPLCKRGALTS